MPHNRGTRRNPRYVGLVSYKGHTKWVGTHSSIAAYKQAEHERLIELRAEVTSPRDGESRPSWSSPAP
jgi:hypothetical protein